MKNMLKLTASLFVICHSSAFAAAPYPQYEALVEKHAALQRLDKNIVWAVMGRESSGNRFAKRHVFQPKPHIEGMGRRQTPMNGR